MQQTKGLLGVVFFLSLLVVSPVRSETAVTTKTGSDQDVQVLLKKIQVAAQRLNYSGTFVYQQANEVRSSRITHILSGKNEIEKLEVMDGKPREYIRNNEDVACYVPEAKTVLLEKRLTRDVFPAILAASPADLADHYTIRMDESGRVAGHDCQAVVMEPKDKLRYGYRFCADQATGLLLKAQTLDGKGNLVEQISFTQIEIGNIDHNRVKPSFANTNGWHVENSIVSQSHLSGWTVVPPPGFHKIQEVKRLISDAQASGNASSPHPAASPREVSQIVFTDGLAAISVFIEPGVQNRSEGAMQQGALNIVSRRQGDYWLTVVGEVPGVAIRQVSNSIEFKSK
ncbi:MULTISPECIES: MucB/RseB C-terminal domain-containing protein [unclassified Herbaspirillum]|uniref:MucB/RseB C-terminal domain-containing protein n=1 Tax=unclassified Herbaspirillum TaxID=2624150 RepID=UPI00160ADF7B|nr:MULTISPECIES: MucB/RseB C-terminal domain-containing protein [unclassified Herbaspirillum]